MPGLPPVQMRLLLQPEHEHLADRHFTAAAATLRYYGEWYGAYPYASLTIVDPPFQSDSGGMEYPDDLHRRHALAVAAGTATIPNTS